jgi:hypothetical protein
MKFFGGSEVWKVYSSSGCLYSGNTKKYKHTMLVLYGLMEIICKQKERK